MLISFFILIFFLNSINSSTLGFFVNECPSGWRALNPEKKFIFLDLDEMSKLNKDRKLRDKTSDTTVTRNLIISEGKSKTNKQKNETTNIEENLDENIFNNGLGTNLVVTREKIDHIENPEKISILDNLAIQCEKIEMERNVSASKVEDMKKEIDGKNKKIEELNTSHKFYKFILALFTVASIVIAYSFWRRKYTMENNMNMFSNYQEMGNSRRNNFNL